MRTFPRSCLWAAIGLALSAGACVEDAPPTGVSPQAVVPPGGYPEIDFSKRPAYLPSNVVVLTFDDGPDWNNTAKVLDVLAQKQVKATFFVNTENWSNVNTDGPMQDLVRRMVNEGHELGSHSVHHHHMATLSADAIEAELRGVETTLANVLGAGAPRLTLFRAPFGEPYQGNDPSFPSAGYQLVAPIVAKHAVHIGWAIDSFDYNCAPGDGACVFNNVKNSLAAGDHGVILLHSVHAQTAAALPQIIDHVRAKGYQIWSVEDVVRARYGKSSAELVDGGGGGGGGAGGGGGGGGGGGACDAPAYTPGVAYAGGDRVLAGGHVYECKPWPFSGWCGAGAAYAPGSGFAWADAWVQVGPCAGGGGGGGGGGGPDAPAPPGEPGDGEYRLARLTYFTSYPDPGSDECVNNNGCLWAGYFAFLDGQQSRDWVMQHNIAAVHSRDADTYRLKTLRLRQGGRQIDAVVYDMCADSDCGGCCTRNASETGFLIDLERHTADRFGADDGVVEWTCLDCD